MRMSVREVRANRAKRPIGLTMIEVLVVIAVVAVLMALLLPAVQTARESSRRIGCRSNLRSLALACQAYQTSYNVFPSGVILGGGQGNTMSQHALLLPYFGQEQLYDMINFRVPSYNAQNATAIKTVVSGSKSGGLARPIDSSR